jgi:membrane fusion protein, heavy metal efflux system
MRYRIKNIIICIIVVLFIAAVFISQMKSQDIKNNKEITTPDNDGAEKRSDNDNEEADHKDENVIKLTESQIKRFDIKSMTLTKSHFQHRVTFPGQIALNENKITHVVSSVPGTVKEIYKGLGEEVKSGEALATLQSREMAEAKSLYISAYKNLDLNKDLFERDEKLWKKNVKAEVQFIQARNSYENAKIDLERSKQKLLALAMTEEQINKLPEQTTPLNTYTIEAPIDGKIIERHITLGEVVSSDKQVFVIANLDTVWVNLAIPAEELPEIKNNQKVDIFAHQGESILAGTIMYVSPVINEESRTGRAVIQLDNPNHELHPGDFIKAQVIVSEQSAFINLPSTSIQRINGQSVVFVRSNDGSYMVRPIQIKGSDKGEFVEILEGLQEGDEVVVTNTFLLKAELGKSEAEHSH